MTRLGLMSAFVVAAVGYGVATSGALAQNDGTEAEQEACTPDVFRLCEAYIPNERPIVACLKLNRVKLSPACSRVFFPANAQAGSAPMTPVPVRKHKHKHRKPAST